MMLQWNNINATDDEDDYSEPDPRPAIQDQA